MEFLVRKSLESTDMFELGRWLLAGIVGFLASIPELTWFLMWLMLADVSFGLLAAYRHKDLDPDEFREGVTDKLGRLMVIAVMALIDRYVDLFGIDLVTVSSIAYIGPEILSISRNATLAGIPVPEQLKSVLRYFNELDENADKPLSENTVTTGGRVRSKTNGQQ